MITSTEDWALVLWIGLHATGLLIACMCRLPLTNWLGKLLHIALPAGFVMISYLAYNSSGSLGWIVSAATFGLMMMASVWESNKTSHDPLLLRLLSTHEM